MTRLRPILALLLALAVTLTTGAEASARIQRVGAFEVVLCDGHGGMTTLWLDGQGQPMAPPHDCPDCLPGLLATLTGLAVVPTPPMGHGRPLPFPGATRGLPAPPPVALARGPPALS